MTDKPRSVYLRGAEDGLVLGPLMSLAVVLVGVTTYVPWVFFPACAALVAVPVAVYVMLRRSYAEDYGTSTISALWLHGICAFFFGGLIMAVVAYVCMRWLRPSFVADQFRAVIEIYSAAPQTEAREMAEALQKAVSARALPTPIEIALELLYAAVFTGSLLSVVMAMVVRHRGGKTPPPISNNM
ncbi:MAG: DUF4199 domain-containing protein [Bacteroidales bacterium]|nr:DUF4199 domain-containing protein [Bacteroidales bacterium]